MQQTLPGLVKVGFTSHLPEVRAAQLHTTGVPFPFDVEYRCLSMKPKKVERRAHELLADCRVSNRREFFRAEPGRVIEAIEHANLSLNGVAAYSESSITRIRRNTRFVVPAEPNEIILLLRHRDPSRALTSSPKILDMLQVHDPRSQLELYGITEAKRIPGLSDPDSTSVRDPSSELDRNQREQNGSVVAVERLIPGDQLLWVSAQEKISSRVFEVSDWCQLVGRTWSPSLLQGQVPPLWNFLGRDSSPGTMLHARERIATLPAPRSWSPDHGEDLSDLQRELLSSKEWLRQLRS